MNRTIQSFSKILILAVAALFVSACNDYEVPQSPEYLQMMDLLAEKSITGDVAGLRLPKSYELSKLPQDPNNPLTKEKVELGKLLFHETGLAINPENTISMNTYSCASCHHAGAGFQSGTRQGMGDGGESFGANGEMRKKNVDCPEDKVDVQPLKSPSILNIGYQTNLLWNGQFGAGFVNRGTEANWKDGTPLAVNKLGYEGTEVQAIAGFTVHRLGVNIDLLNKEPYKSLFQNAFPSIDITTVSEDKAKEIIGLAIAAYERTVVSDLAPFQQYISGDESSLANEELEGMKLFFGKAECYTCHNGPALNSMKFYALGMNDLAGADIIDLKDANAAKGRGGFTKNPTDDYKFKVPQLYNLKDAAFYGHGATFNSIEELIAYKNTGVAENAKVPASQLAPGFKPLNLSKEEIEQLVAFIENGLSDPDLRRYEPIYLPSGNCFPNNDPLSKSQICN